MEKNTVENLRKEINRYLLICYVIFPIFFVAGFLYEVVTVLSLMFHYYMKIRFLTTTVLIQNLIIYSLYMIPILYVLYLIWFSVKSNNLIKKLGGNNIVFSIINIFAILITLGLSVFIAPLWILWIKIKHKSLNKSN